MHVIITRLPIGPDADWAEMGRRVEAFDRIATAASPGFKGVSLIRSSPEEAVLFVLFEGRDELDRVSREVAAPWFAENIRPFLTGAVTRTVGEVMAGRLAGS
ncbi:MAG: hypothetical protein HY245_07000 [Rhizobiales bacterium]|nr:hypothetical protein [Hyphomicrobiales bacterium]MBI3673152.1 hypothetical protein [Hyphomicrobiales bacterium]